KPTWAVAWPRPSAKEPITNAELSLNEQIVFMHFFLLSLPITRPSRWKGCEGARRMLSQDGYTGSTFSLPNNLKRLVSLPSESIAHGARTSRPYVFSGAS